MTRISIVLLIGILALGCAVTPRSDTPVVVEEPAGPSEASIVEVLSSEQPESKGGAQGFVSSDKRHEERGPHDLGVFIGYEWERGGGGPALGLDYSYRVIPEMALGAFFEYVSGSDSDISAFGVVGSFHPIEPLAIVVGPGVEYEHSDRSALLRVGATYDFPLRGISLAPSVFYDFVSGSDDAFILGLGIGLSF